jgi:hypothetical protein
MLVKQGYGDIRIWYTLNERYAENAWKWFYVGSQLSVIARDKQERGGCRHVGGAQPYEGT